MHKNLTIQQIQAFIECKLTNAATLVNNSQHVNRRVSILFRDLKPKCQRLNKTHVIENDQCRPCASTRYLFIPSLQQITTVTACSYVHVSIRR